MLCQFCGKHNATISFKGIVNNQTIKWNLCESCARKNGLMFPFGKSVLSLGEMVSDLAHRSKTARRTLSLQCPLCGLSYTELKQSSQFGCSQCYDTFASLVGPLLKQIHGSAQHVGKTYKRTVRPGSVMEELSELKLELREALKDERYENAAQLRDQIRTLEATITKSER